MTLRRMYYLGGHSYEVGDDQEEEQSDEVQLGVLEVNGKPVTVIVLSEEQAAQFSELMGLVEVEAGSLIV